MDRISILFSQGNDYKMDCGILLGKEESKETNSRIRESGSAREKKNVWKKDLGNETFGVYIIDVSK